MPDVPGLARGSREADWRRHVDSAVRGRTPRSASVLLREGRAGTVRDSDLLMFTTVMSMITVPTEPIGSIPRPVDLIERVAHGDSEDPDLAPLHDAAIRDTIERFEATGSPVVTDGEQRKYHNFATYCIHGLPNTAPDGLAIPFSDGHTRRLPRLTRGPFRYRRYADCYLDVAMRYAHVRVKQAVISPSALSMGLSISRSIVESHGGRLRGCRQLSARRQFSLHAPHLRRGT